MARHYLSLKQVGNATPKEASQREQVIKESVDWLGSFEAFVTQFKILIGQIKAVDKTYLCTSPWHKYVKHMGPRGSIKSRKVTGDRGTGIFFRFSTFFLFLLLLLYSFVTFFNS